MAYKNLGRLNIQLEGFWEGWRIGFYRYDESRRLYHYSTENRALGVQLDTYAVVEADLVPNAHAVIRKWMVDQEKDLSRQT